MHNAYNFGGFFQKWSPLTITINTSVSWNVNQPRAWKQSDTQHAFCQANAALHHVGGWVGQNEAPHG